MKTLIILILAASCYSGFSQYQDPPVMEITEMHIFQTQGDTQQRAIHSVIALTAVFIAAEYYLRTENAEAYKITTHYVFPSVAGITVIYTLRPDFLGIGRKKNRY